MSTSGRWFLERMQEEHGPLRARLVYPDGSSTEPLELENGKSVIALPVNRAGIVDRADLLTQDDTIIATLPVNWRISQPRDAIIVDWTFE